ncbi:hypothetical protein PsorP6_015162 [Peronosclerospora sorghi]|uniref:Uncharacterized protein n=1 Tax=Peronosclerospora sorghi TaxID=230839 RepID=A0ACC0VU00_9STRA|nr:hypothetical protein PsorP6_015162 [Peronosclerospora sorghi]
MKALTSLLDAVTAFGVLNALSPQGPATGNATEEETWKAFFEFANRFDKTYRNDDDHSNEVQHRYSHFKENLAFINEHNKDFYTDKESFLLAVNALTDLTEDEFNAMKGYHARSDRQAAATAMSVAPYSNNLAEVIL